MPSGLESLHKVLKDEKRRRIILSINMKGSRSYTDLLNELGIDSTGKLNYHLKILNGLIAKNEIGQYVLTDKGKLAVSLLQEFGSRKSQSETEAPFPKGYMVVVSLFSVTVIAVDFALYLFGNIPLNSFVNYLVATVLGFVFLVVAERARVKRSMWQPNKQMLGAKISIIAAGAVAGVVVCFFGGSLLVIGLARLGVMAFSISFTSWMILSSMVGVFAGGFMGYLIYRRSRFSKMSYYNPFAE